MGLHLRRLVAWRGEHFGCLQFRKVANWYSKALRMTKADHHTLMRLDTTATFASVAGRLREQGAPPGWLPPDASESAIAVPAGPIAHW
jgi:hypothetical protein